MQVCTLLQTENHASTPPLSFYRPDALPVTQSTESKHWRQKSTATHYQIICEIHHVPLTAFAGTWKLLCSRFTSVHSALEVLQLCTISHWLSSSPLQHSRTTVRACDLTLHNFTLHNILTNCKRITHIYFFSLHPNRLVLLCKMSLNTLATSSKTWQTTDTKCYFINNSSGGVGEPTPRKQGPSFTSPAMNQKHIPRPVCDFPWQTSRQCSGHSGSRDMRQQQHPQTISSRTSEMEVTEDKINHFYLKMAIIIKHG